MNGLKQIKLLAEKNNITLTIHPDQFVVLNSDKSEVINKSIDILKHHDILCNILGINIICLHIGKKNTIEKFIDTFIQLDQSIKNKLCIENDHYYNIYEVLELCELLEIPCIYDLHHSRITGYEATQDILTRVASTWGDNTPVVHISSGKDYIDHKSHSDYISIEDWSNWKGLIQHCIIEVEAKYKNLAIDKLKQL